MIGSCFYTVAGRFIKISSNQYNNGCKESKIKSNVEKRPVKLSEASIIYQSIIKVANAPAIKTISQFVFPRFLVRFPEYVNTPETTKQIKTKIPLSCIPFKLLLMPKNDMFIHGKNRAIQPTAEAPKIIFLCLLIVSKFI